MLRPHLPPAARAVTLSDTLAPIADGVLAARSASGVVHLRLDRPQRKNALTVEMYAALTAALDAAEADDGARAVVFTGAGDAFCAGNDLADFLDRPPTDADAPVFRFLLALARGTRPLVAAVHGPAIGIGTTLLLHVDASVATPDARLALPFVALGVVPEAASSLLLPLRVGPAVASEMLLLGRSLRGEEAHGLGLVTHLADREAVDARALALGEAFAAQPPRALRASRALLRAPWAEAVEAALVREGLAFRDALAGDEARSILRARLRR